MYAEFRGKRNNEFRMILNYASRKKFAIIKKSIYRRNHIISKYSKK